MAFRSTENGGDHSNDMAIYLGKSVHIKGELRFEGSGRIDGTVEGKVVANGIVTLGEEGHVSSVIEGDTVVVSGRVQGKIVARAKILLLKTSVVHADIMAPCFSIEEGAQFNGGCRMTGADESSASPERLEDRPHTSAKNR
ncbi:MAG TPA: polymer-forming cytoskeletal protein [Nitrospiria bacterium]